MLSVILYLPFFFGRIKGQCIPVHYDVPALSISSPPRRGFLFICEYDIIVSAGAALPVPAPEPRKRFTPPTVAEISQHISDKLKENNISWLPEQITGTAEIIFNFYDSKGWKVGKETMQKWKAAVTGWLGRDNWVSRVRPRQSQSQQLPVPSFPVAPVNQQAPKSFREQDRDYAIRHNRTAELSAWDFGKLEEELAALECEGVDLSGLKFNLDALDGGAVTTIDNTSKEYGEELSLIHISEPTRP